MNHFEKIANETILDPLIAKLLTRISRDFPGVTFALAASLKCAECGETSVLQYSTCKDADEHRRLLQQCLDDTHVIREETVVTDPGPGPIIVIELGGPHGRSD